MAALNHGQQ